MQVSVRLSCRGISDPALNPAQWGDGVNRWAVPPCGLRAGWESLEYCIGPLRQVGKLCSILGATALGVVFAGVLVCMNLQMIMHSKNTLHKYFRPFTHVTCVCMYCMHSNMLYCIYWWPWAIDYQPENMGKRMLRPAEKPPLHLWPRLHVTFTLCV